LLKIYGRSNSINVRKVLWLCDEVGLTYERFDYGRGYTPTDAPEFMKVSRFGVVPVIDDDGFILRESNTIVRYLAAKLKREDLYPTDLRKRATIEAWMDWASTDLGTPVREVFWGVHMKHADFSDPKRIERGVAALNGQMQRLDHHLAGSGPYVAGSHFTVADIPVGLAVNRFFSVDFTRAKLDAVAAYYERLSERPAYKRHGRNGTP
jgi:glutathione S-transferase